MPSSSPRPASVLLAFLGDHVAGRGVWVSSASVIAALEPAGIAESATRATLGRMVNRGLLRRRQEGRKAYFTTTPRADAIIADGAERVHATDVVRAEWDGTWTMVTFTMPDSFQRERHLLRSQLTWAGFGLMQSGVWIAPGAVRLPSEPGGRRAQRHLRVFTVQAADTTDPVRLAADAYDLRRLAAGYSAFTRRWSGRGPARPVNPLARRLVLTTEWLDLVRSDPRLPAELLPATWPAVSAQSLFRSLWADLSPGAEREAASILDLIPA